MVNCSVYRIGPPFGGASFSLNRKTDGAHSNFLAPETNEQIHNDRFFRIREAIFDFETYGFPLEDSGQATFGA